MNIAIWIFQGILAFTMLATGFLKLASNKEQFKASGKGNLDWVDSLTPTQLKLIGVVETLIGVGLILPQLLGLQLWLTPVAAIGAIITMIGAFVLHIKRGDDFKSIATNFSIMGVASIVLYGRIDFLG
ncbi:MAG: DoxX family protein [Fidelibacterota bacterium]|jgi:hypothetical protein|tara:strand:+ start:1472 stop:1855 length:384 start_codon:yes stop_codon:yes gene_type:complete